MQNLPDFSHDEKTAMSDLMAEIFSEKPYPQIPEIEIQKKIGQGGMGSVYLGKQTYLDRAVAVKVIHLNSCSDMNSFVLRFQREAKLLASLSHSNIVSCYHAGSLPDGKCYLVMEFIEGMDLGKYVQKNGVLAEPQAIAVLKCMSMALEHAYSFDIIHRDIKPENVLLQHYDIRKSSTSLINQNFPYNVKLVDLGLAKITNVKCEQTVTQEGQIMGTPAYMPPEQFEDIETLDYRGDIYSLGCVLYYMLTGRHAFPQNGIHAIMLQKLENNLPGIKQHNPKVSDAVSQIIHSMLQRDREERPQSYQEIIEFCTNYEQKRKDESSISNKPTVVVSTSEIAPRKKRSSVAAFFFLPLIAGFLYLAFYTVNFTEPKEKVIAKTEQEKIPLPLENTLSQPNTKEPTTQKTPPTILPPQITDTEKLAPKDFSWGKKSSLFSDTKFEQRLESWQFEPNNTGWSASEEGSGVFGFGTSYIMRELEKSPWKIEATIIPLGMDSREWSIHFLLSNGNEIEINWKMLKGILTTVSEKSNSGQKKTLLSATSPQPQSISFTAIHYSNTLEITTNSQKNTLDKLSAPIEKIKLSAKKSKGIHFESLQIFYDNGK
ncbi:MAG: serine/threonine protein kinase [Candidatus Brocadiae bacterium]|nr:serine/threonine protein kinase [Candidatus Brocadiia bacterium]